MNMSKVERGTDTVNERKSIDAAVVVPDGEPLKAGRLEILQS